LLDNQESSNNNTTSPGNVGPKVVSRIVEKGTFLQGFGGIFKEGSPKLQIAYLNIFNLIFCDEYYSGYPTSYVAASLNASRNVLAKNKGMIQFLIRLAEHGASNTIRSKSLLSLQLLLRFSPCLMTGVGEKRLPSILARIVDPISKEGNSQSQFLTK